jgi:hypothetical protein
MPMPMTRSRSIQVWFAAVAFLIVAAVVSGATVTIGTGAALVALTLVPPVLVLLMWPAGQLVRAPKRINATHRRS